MNDQAIIKSSLILHRVLFLCVFCSTHSRFRVDTIYRYSASIRAKFGRKITFSHAMPVSPAPWNCLLKLDVVMYSCLHGQAPRYLTNLCMPVSDVSARQNLRSATRLFGGSAMPAQHTRSTGLLCGRTVALEVLSTRQLERSASSQRQL